MNHQWQDTSPRIKAAGEDVTRCSSSVTQNTECSMIFNTTKQDWVGEERTAWRQQQDVPTVAK